MKKLLFIFLANERIILALAVYSIERNRPIVLLHELAYSWYLGLFPGLNYFLHVCVCVCVCVRVCEHDHKIWLPVARRALITLASGGDSLFSELFRQDRSRKELFIYKASPENKQLLLAEFIFRTSSDRLSRHFDLNKKIKKSIVF